MKNTLELKPKSKNLKTIAIGEGQPVFTIAEIGLNHNGDLTLGKKLIDAANDAGCSSVKFQNFETDEVYIKGKKAGKYKLLGKEIDIYDLHKSLEIEASFLSTLKEYAEERGLFFFSAPMGKNALSTLLKIECDLVKISSYEISNLPWIKEVAQIRKPIILSCGGAKLEEVDRALNEIYKFHDEVALMHCIIKYPADLDDANLKVIQSLKSVFEIPVGFSNNGFRHDTGAIDFKDVPYTGTALGMDLYEVHITLDREMAGVDQGFSTEPNELREMISLINNTRQDFLKSKDFSLDDRLLGSGIKKTLPCETYVRDFAYKSIFTIKNITKGEKLDLQNIKCLRPGESSSGLEPLYFNVMLEHFYAKVDLEPFEPLTWDKLTR